jgi:hypothetical protein
MTACISRPSAKYSTIPCNIMASLFPVAPELGDNIGWGRAVMKNVSLTQNEIRMLVQSLDHCLATCHNEEKSAGTACSDCEAAKALRQKLSAELAA